jgi:hypothetical protein
VIILATCACYRKGSGYAFDDWVNVWQIRGHVLIIISGLIATVIAG